MMAKFYSENISARDSLISVEGVDDVFTLYYTGKLNKGIYLECHKISKPTVF